MRLAIYKPIIESKIFQISEFLFPSFAINIAHSDFSSLVFYLFADK